MADFNLNQYLGRDVFVTVLENDHVAEYNCKLDGITEYGAVLSSTGTHSTNRFMTRLYPWDRISSIDLQGRQGQARAAS